MNAVVNGKPRLLPDAATISDLLVTVGTGPGLLVVELNGLIIDAPSFPVTAIHEGDRVEIVRFVGGG